MAGLLAWAADVVGGSSAGYTSYDNDPNSIPLIFSPEQLSYAQELDSKAASLKRSIQDLRLRLPPPDISQRLPHLHAHSLASNADLALQLNAHSSTKEQAQLREIRLQEENAEYEKAISSCENKIQERLQEARLLESKLKELDITEKNLQIEFENAQAALLTSQSQHTNKPSTGSQTSNGEQVDLEDAKSALLDKLECKKKELASIEVTVQDLEKKWAEVQDNALKQPSSAQREKILDKQLHSLIEQLEAKQAQAERLITEIHLKEMELERLNGRLEANSADANTARNRSGRSSSFRGSLSSDYIVDPHHKLQMVGIRENLQRLMLLRSAFVLYILALHILVFIKISF